MSDEMKKADLSLGLAAAITERACELIQDGWVKGRMKIEVDGAPVQFCIHGALNLAIKEIFGDRRLGAEAEVLAVAFIVDEAQSQYNFNGSWKDDGIPAAAFNDNPSTKHQDVLNIMSAAARRLWDLSLEQESAVGDSWQPSRWVEADVESEEAKQFLYASLGN
jgi:hypothetical protein